MAKNKSDKKIEKKVEEKKTNKKNSTFQIGVIIALTILLFILCIVLIVREISAYSAEQKLIKEFNKYYESEDMEIIFYNHTGCEFCELQLPILEQIAKDYDLDYLNLNSAKLSESQNEDIIKKLGIKGATPTTLVVKDGKVLATQVGYVQGNKYVDFFVDAGVLEEGSKYLPEKNLTFIDYEQFAELQSSEEPVIIAIGGATCEYCASAKPILSNLSAAYNVPIYYITLDYISTEDRLSLVEDLESMEYDDETFVSTGKLSTPIVLIVKEEKISAQQTGLGNVTTYTKMFKDAEVVE